jgi:hypothetical protein
LVKAPSDEELADARVFVQQADAQVPVRGGMWFVLADGRVLVRHPSGGWERSMFSADTLTTDGEWSEVETFQVGDEQPADLLTVDDRLGRKWTRRDEVWTPVSEPSESRTWPDLLAEFGPLRERARS